MNGSRLHPSPAKISCEASSAQWLIAVTVSPPTLAVPHAATARIDSRECNVL
nr:hypothetical protein [Nonomuraea cypriaca]